HFERHRKVARALLTAESTKSYELVLERAQGEIAELLREVSARSQPLPLLQDVVVSYGERLSASLLAEILRADDLAAQYVDARRCITTNSEHGCAAPVFDETIKRTRAEVFPLVEKTVIPVLGGFIASSSNGATTTPGRARSDEPAAIIPPALSAQ